MLWAAGLLLRGAEAIWNLLFRRHRRQASNDPAEALRSKLAQARELENEPESPQPAPPPVVAETEPEAPASGLDDRRRDVHERARALAEEMRGKNEDG
jgi:hypothetical protein